MNAALLACVASTLFMAGLAWFVQVVHYPLFPLVDRARFPEFHDLHSRTTSLVVLIPMTVELLSSIVLAIDPPEGTGPLALAGAILAVAIWGLTGAVLAPLHGRIGREGPSEANLSRLVRLSWPRTTLWSLHAIVALAILERVVGSG
jgi:hypothetical protein